MTLHSIKMSKNRAHCTVFGGICCIIYRRFTCVLNFILHCFELREMSVKLMDNVPNYELPVHSFLLLNNFVMDLFLTVQCYK